MVTMAFAFRWAEDPFYYANGEKLYWFPQYDVYAFRTVGDLSYKKALDHEVVERLDFRNNYPDKLHLVYFNQNSSNWQRLQVIDDIEQDIAFARSFPVITMFENTPSGEGMWYVADDMVMVMYKNDSVRQANESRIVSKYSLEQINDPSNLPAGGNYAYVYRWDVRDLTVENSVELSRIMYEQDSAVLWSVEPNLIRGFEPVWEEEEEELTGLAPSMHSEATAATLYVSQPGGGMLNVHVICREPRYKFRMYDLLGRLLTERNLTADDTQIPINVSHLSGGVYFGTLETLSGQPFATVKFMKQ